MKKLHTLAFAAATCFAALSYGQTSMTSSRGVSSIQNNPGILGHEYSDLSFGWTDFRNSPTEGYDAAFSANVPLAPSIDAGLGYNYYWEAKHRDPFSRTSMNDRHHALDAYAKYYVPMRGVKPFIGGGVGYEWHRGDIQRLRTYDHEWTWTAMGGVEIPVGAFAIIPQISYDDNMHGGSIGMWSYGAQVHHWFTEKIGGYVDATYMDPRGPGAELWRYMAGMRFRF